MIGPHPDWPDLELEIGKSHVWRRGELQLEISRDQVEWRVDRTPPEADGRARRFIASWPKRLAGTPLPARLSLRPALADRSVVVRPMRPLTIAAGASLRIYVSTPIWLQLRLADDSIWLDEASQRPSDTWFGAAPTEGVLAYASRTRATVPEKPLETDPLRANTPIDLINRGKQLLAVSRINLPVDLLRIWSSAGLLWTEALIIRATELGTDSDAELEIGNGAPVEAADAKLLAPARTRRERNLLTWRLESLIR